jgi:acyl-homoserine lactone acylase PvdQ
MRSRYPVKWKAKKTTKFRAQQPNIKWWNWKKKIQKRNVEENKYESTQVHSTNPPPTAWDWDKKISLFFLNDLEKKFEVK